MQNKKITLLFLSLLMAHLVSAQKVALVLSGGGAKGLAHVGVIRALEEHNIPIDYIVGTSMGGVIGGCYAAGFSPDQIEDIVASPKFQGWVKGEFNDKYNFYYSKGEEDASWFTLNLSLDSTLSAQFNGNLASDLLLNFALSEKLAQESAAANYDFDSLFIPFRAVASEVFTQSEVVLGKGNLHSAIRATLSVPFFYRPIKVDGKYLFDGGIYNNFPVDVARREFKPDVIIGVNVSSKVFEEYPHDKDDKLISQSLIFMLLDKSNPTSVGADGFYIEPSLKGYSSFDFDKVKALIDSGYAAGLRQVGQIKKQIVRRSDCESLATRRNAFGSKVTPYKFKDIAFYGFNTRQQAYIKKTFGFKDGKEYYLNDIKTGYYKLVSENYFQTIYPSITYDKALDGYVLEIYDRPESNIGVNLGGTLSTRNISQMFLGLKYYRFNKLLTKYSLGVYAGNFYKSAFVNARINFPGKHQFYLEPSATFNNWDFLDLREILIKERSPTIIDQIDRKFNLAIGAPLGNKYKLTANAALINNIDRFSNKTTLVSTDTLDRLELDGQRYEVNLSSNTLNKKQYANAGKFYEFSLNYFDLKEKYEPGNTSLITENTQDRNWFSLKIKLEQYFNIRNYSYGYYIESVFSNQPFFSNFTGTIVNTQSFNPLQDSRTLFLQKIRAHNFLGVGFRNVFNIRKNFDIRAEGYLFKAFNSIEQSSTQEARYNEFDEGFFVSGTLGAVLHSPVGPISLNFNYYDDPENKFGLLVHLGYLLFNKRSLE